MQMVYNSLKCIEDYLCTWAGSLTSIALDKCSAAFYGKLKVVVQKVTLNPLTVNT